VEDDPSPSQAEEHSGGAVVPQMGGETGSSRVDESGTAVSSEATTSHQVGQFEDAGDDSVVPSTPKLSAGSSSASQTGSAAGTQATTAPTVPQLRGRGVARARRSRAGPRSGSGMSRGANPP